MIPAPPGLVATYKHAGPPGHHTERKIIAFDNEGVPLVVGDHGKYDDRRLIRADIYNNYDGITDDPYPDYVALLPAGGWRVGYTSSGEKSSAPLVGWALKADGDVVPIDSDGDGLIHGLDHMSGEFRIYHPDAIDTAADPSQAQP